METKLFKAITPSQFAGTIKWFTNKTAEVKARLEDAAAYAVGKVYHSGDVTHANKLAEVIEAFGLGPRFRRCVVPVIPFKYNKETHVFEGKVQKGKRASLEQLNGDGIPNWEVALRALFDRETTPKEKKEVDYIKRLASAIAAAVEHGVTEADAIAMVKDVYTKKAVEVKAAA